MPLPPRRVRAAQPSGTGPEWPWSAPSPPSSPAPRVPASLTCGRVARERTAPGAARAPNLAALAQLFLLVLPPPALSHGRDAEAQPGTAGEQRPRRPVRWHRAPLAGALWAGKRPPERRWGRRLKEPPPPRTPPAAGGGAARRGPSRVPRLLAAHRRPPPSSSHSLPPSSSLPRPAEFQPGIGRARAEPRPLGEGLLATRAALPPHAANTPSTQTDPSGILKRGRELGRGGGLASSCPSTTFRCQQETHLLDTETKGGGTCPGAGEIGQLGAAALRDQLG